MIRQERSIDMSGTVRGLAVAPHGIDVLQAADGLDRRVELVPMMEVDRHENLVQQGQRRTRPHGLLAEATERDAPDLEGPLTRDSMSAHLTSKSWICRCCSAITSSFSVPSAFNSWTFSRISSTVIVAISATSQCF